MATNRVVCPLEGRITYGICSICIRRHGCLSLTKSSKDMTNIGNFCFCLCTCVNRSLKESSLWRSSSSDILIQLSQSKLFIISPISVGSCIETNFISWIRWWQWRRTWFFIKLDRCLPNVWVLVKIYFFRNNSIIFIFLCIIGFKVSFICRQIGCENGILIR